MACEPYAEPRGMGRHEVRVTPVTFQSIASGLRPHPTG